MAVAALLATSIALPALAQIQQDNQGGVTIFRPGATSAPPATSPPPGTQPQQPPASVGTPTHPGARIVPTTPQVDPGGGVAPAPGTGLAITPPVRAGRPFDGFRTIVPAVPRDGGEELLAQVPPLTPTAATALTTALKAIDEQRWNDARASIRAAASPALSRYVDWSILRHPRGDGVFFALQAFLRENPDWPDDLGLRRSAEEKIVGETPPAELLAYFRAFPPLTSASHMRRLEATAAGAPGEIAGFARDTWRTATLRATDEVNFLARYASQLRPADQLARFDRLMREGKDKIARDLVPKLAAEDRPVAEARLAFVARAPEATALLRAVPPARQADRILQLERVRWLRRGGDQAGATQALMSLDPSIEQDDDWWTERQIAAREAIAGNRADEAYRLAAAHGLKRGVAFAEAEFMAGWIALRWQKKADVAITHFTRLDAGVATPVSKSRAAFWLGRAYETARRAEDASAWYERAAQHGHTYYGQLAAKRLPGRAPRMPVDPEATPADRDTLERRDIVSVARWLKQVGDEERARPFLARIGRLGKSAGEIGLSAGLALELGRPDIAVSIARGAVERGVQLYAAAFPVVDLGATGSIERALVLALSRQESGFMTSVSSPAGALGLMQLMPETARAMARKTSQPFDVARLTTDPAYNVSLGTQYLADMLEKFGGSYELALAGYNAGPNRVVRWLDTIGDPRGGAIDMVDWVEMIPFRETRNYVQRVMEGVVVYRDRLGGTFKSVPPPRR